MDKCVYAYLRKDGTPYYIGQGSMLRPYQKHTKKIPPKERIVIIDSGLTENQAKAFEIFWIALYGRKDLGTGILVNLTDGGEGLSNVGPETRKKMSDYSKNRPEEHNRNVSEALKGRKLSPEHKEKCKNGRLGKEPWNKGVPMTDETKEKVSQSLQGNGLGKPKSDEMRKKLSESRKGMKFSDEHKANLKIARNNRKPKL